VKSTDLRITGSDIGSNCNDLQGQLYQPKLVGGALLNETSYCQFYAYGNSIACFSNSTAGALPVSCQLNYANSNALVPGPLYMQLYKSGIPSEVRLIAMVHPGTTNKEVPLSAPFLLICLVLAPVVQPAPLQLVLGRYPNITFAASGVGAPEKTAIRLATPGNAYIECKIVAIVNLGSGIWRITCQVEAILPVGVYGAAVSRGGVFGDAVPVAQVMPSSFLPPWRSSSSVLLT